MEGRYSDYEKQLKMSKQEVKEEYKKIYDFVLEEQNKISTLLKSGANLIDKQRLLKESKEDFIRRQDYVRNSEVINETVAICVMDDIFQAQQALQ